MFKDIKTHIYEIVFYLLKDDEPSLYSYCLFLTIQFLQTLYYVFHYKIVDVWQQDTFANDVATALSYLHIVIPLGNNVTFSTYLAIFYLAVAFIVLLFLVTALVSY
jgi:hypothetical protein